MIIVVKMTTTQYLQLHDYFGQQSQHVLIKEMTLWRNVWHVHKCRTKLSLVV